MFSRIEKLAEKKIVGYSMQMYFAENKTVEVWKNFMPKVKRLNSPIHIHLYSVEVYNDVIFSRTLIPVVPFKNGLQ